MKNGLRRGQRKKQEGNLKAIAIVQLGNNDSLNQSGDGEVERSE